MRQMFKRTAAGLAGMLVMATMTGCGSFDSDEVVATVGNDEITAGMANFYARMQQAQYESYYASMMGTSGEAMWTQQVDEEGTTYEESVKESLLTSLENLYLMKQHASEYEVVLTEEELKDIQEAAVKFDEDNALEDKEAVSGYQKYVEEYLRLTTIAYKMDAPMKEGVDEEVSDEEAAQKSMKYVYFAYSTKDEEGNSKDMTDEEKKDLKKTAQEFAKNLKDSDAKDIDAAAQAAGYEVQSTTFDSDSVSPDAKLVEAVDALETEGGVTDVIESDYGLYVGKLTSLLDRGATDQEKKNIVEERKKEQYDGLIEKWRKNSQINEDEKIWDKIDFAKQGVTIKESNDQYDEIPDAE
nr:SurA N-terminal domain-containing protein [Mediterraneibacter agrestimuris]